MTKEQRTVEVSAVCGIIAMWASVSFLYQLIPSPGGAEVAEGRLAYALQANLFAVLPLCVMIIWVANGRFGTLCWRVEAQRLDSHRPADRLPPSAILP